MKCPKCKASDKAIHQYGHSELTRYCACESCGCVFTEWQQSKIEALENQISSLKALMREKEWSGLYNSFGVATCLFCENDRIEGHKPDCRIAKALEE